MPLQLGKQAFQERLRSVGYQNINTYNNEENSLYQQRKNEEVYIAAILVAFGR